MKVVSYLATLPKKEQYTSAESLKAATDKLNTLKFFIQGVQACGDEGVIVDDFNYEPSDVAVILGWVHEHGKSAPHLQLRQKILDGQRVYNGRTVIADSNLFLYKDKTNPGYWLRYSFDGIFPNTGEYCDSSPDSSRWLAVQQNLNINLRPWRTQGNHVLLCLQRDGGWSMKGADLAQWTIKTVTRIRQLTNRPILIRPHPKFPINLNNLLALPDVHRSTGNTLQQDLSEAWAAVFYNSSSSVAAVLAGVPVFADDDDCVAWSVANTDLAHVESPAMPGRTQWLYDLSAAHWTDEESRGGAIYQQFVEYLQ